MRSVAIAVGAAISLLVLGCASDDASPPLFGTTAEMQYPVSLDEVVEKSDVVAEITPLRRLPDHWNDTGTLSVARFELRIERVHKGAVEPGTTIIGHAPGGTVKKDFGANRSQRPETGDQVVEREYGDWPYYQVGRTELVFLAASMTEGLGEYYWNLGPGARFTIEDGRLQRVAHSDASIGVQEGLALSLQGKSVAEALLIARLK